jgi:predicted Zn finger-like uncharacterized protein
MLRLQKSEFLQSARELSMPSDGPVPLFNCPSCEALYRVVEAEAGPESADGDVPCWKCGGFLPGRKAGYVLKYFYTRSVGQRRNNLSLAPVHHLSEIVSAA